MSKNELKKIYFVIGTEVPFPGGNTSSKIIISLVDDIKEESQNLERFSMIEVYIKNIFLWSLNQECPFFIIK